jgi:hypothetical protein
VVLIMTDTQHKNMIGAYELPPMRTPALDRLAARDQTHDTLLAFMDDITDPWRSVRNKHFHQPT